MSAWDFIGTKLHMDAVDDMHVDCVEKDYRYSDLKDDAAKAFLCGMFYACGVIHDFPAENVEVPGEMKPACVTTKNDISDYIECWTMATLFELLTKENEKEEQNDAD